MSRAVFSADDGTPLAGGAPAGSGPTVVLLHAGVADRRAWSGVAEGLNEAGAEVIPYDRRGFGETPRRTRLRPCRRPAQRARPGDRRARLADRQLPGRRIALDLALASPERVAGLVLIAPAVSGAPEPDHDQLDPATGAIVDELDEAEDSGDLDAINELEIRLWLDGPAGPAGRVPERRERWR